MPLITLLLLMVAGVGSGLAGYLTGLASLVSYPALLAAGLPPLLANTTNTVGVVGIGVGSSARSFRFLLGRDRRTLMLNLVTALVGGLAGSVLLLVGGDRVFTVLVPWLIGTASIALLFSPKLRALHGETESRLAAGFALFLLCIYGGYFGAGAGVMYIAVMTILTKDGLGTSLIMKSLIFAVANLTASVIFIVTGHVDWPAAIAMGVGSLIGGFLGPTVQRWIPEPVLRIGVSLGGVGLALWLAFH